MQVGEFHGESRMSKDQFYAALAPGGMPPRQRFPVLRNRAPIGESDQDGGHAAAWVGIESG
jgi:hypothetical protein